MTITSYSDELLVFGIFFFLNDLNWFVFIFHKWFQYTYRT